MMNFILGLNREKNTPTFRKDESGLKLKLNISTFYFRVLTYPESVASYSKMGRLLPTMMLLNAHANFTCNRTELTRDRVYTHKER